MIGSLEEKNDLVAMNKLLLTNWKYLKPQLNKQWGKITDDDLDHINGKPDELVNILRKRYGYGKAQAEIEIEHWLAQQELPIKDAGYRKNPSSFME